MVTINRVLRPCLMILGFSSFASADPSCQKLNTEIKSSCCAQHVRIQKNEKIREGDEIEVVVNFSENGTSVERVIVSHTKIVCPVVQDSQTETMVALSLSGDEASKVRLAETIGKLQARPVKK